MAREIVMSETKAARGRRVRAQVLGDARSEPAPAQALPESFVELGLEFAWGTVWAGDQLSVKTRRLITIALLAAQNRPRELAMHMRAALAADCSEEELRAVCVHLTPYCGFPAAGDALRTLGEAAACG
jgi:4-carboxymuconolactone decarboxylase